MTTVPTNTTTVDDCTTCKGCPDCGPSATKRTVEAIAARVSKVTDGPWTAWDRGIGYEVHGPEGEPINDRCRETFAKGDAQFIAMAPVDVNYLLAELRKRDEALARVSRLVDQWERLAGPGSDAERIYKVQQKVSVEFAVSRIRAAVKGASK